MRVHLLLTIAVIVLAGCGASAPAGTDAPRYQADYAACDKSVSDAVDKRNAKKAIVWFASSVTRWSEIDNGVTGCMQAKGWGSVRPCTEEERRQGNQTAALTVTARGISCKDPDAPAKPATHPTDTSPPGARTRP